MIGRVATALIEMLHAACRRSWQHEHTNEWQSKAQPARSELLARTGVSLTQSTAGVREEVLVSFETV